MAFQYQLHTGDDARRNGELLALCEAAFGEFSPAYLSDRLVRITDPCLVAARRADGSLAGFKLGYRRGTALFYSWLGAVHPDSRRQGIARELTLRQHDWAKAQGYRRVETRTRAVNRAMLILNLAAGFEVYGFENDSAGHAIVSQRKIL
jgi:predicted GNAT superfamily acetyltransferase